MWVKAVCATFSERAYEEHEVAVNWPGVPKSAEVILKVTQDEHESIDLRGIQTKEPFGSMTYLW